MVPGWDCHGLPIEWKIEEKYRKSGKRKEDVPLNEFRQECRQFAGKWQKTQAEEFERLGLCADTKKPYVTMDFSSEAAIAKEFLTFLKKGSVYKGVRPIMWSPIEKTALALYESDPELMRQYLTDYCVSGGVCSRKVTPKRRSHRKDRPPTTTKNTIVVGIP